MDTQAVLALYDYEQRMMMEYPGVRREVFPHLVRFVRPAPGMNFILYSHLAEANIDQMIQEQVAYFEPMGQPFTWKVYDHDQPPSFRKHLLNCGFKEDDDPAAIMVLDLEAVPPALLAPQTADIRPITHRDQLEDVIRIESQVWGGDFGWIRQRLGDHLAIEDYLNVYVAYIDDQPACVGWVYFHPHSSFAGLWAGSTVAAYRRRGLYTASLATRVQEALRRGYRFLLVEAGAMSEPIVKNHGFQLLTHVHDYEWKGGDR